MSVLLLIASIALSACSGTDLSAVCMSDMAATTVYAYDVGSGEALVIERFDDYTVNTSYRIETTELDGQIVIKDAWVVDTAGVHDYFSQYWPVALNR